MKSLNNKNCRRYFKSDWAIYNLTQFYQNINKNANINQAYIKIFHCKNLNLHPNIYLDHLRIFLSNWIHQLDVSILNMHPHSLYHVFCLISRIIWRLLTWFNKEFNVKLFKSFRVAEHLVHGTKSNIVD